MKCCLMLARLCGCSSGSTPGSHPLAGITLDKRAITIGSWGVTSAVVATPHDSSGGVTSGAVAWTSDDARVAQVANGVITGVRPGATTVHASAGEFTPSVSVTVPLQSNSACVQPTQLPDHPPTAGAPMFTQQSLGMSSAMYNRVFFIPIDYDRDGDDDLLIVQQSYPGDSPYGGALHVADAFNRAPAISFASARLPRPVSRRNSTGRLLSHPETRQ